MVHLVAGVLCELDVEVILSQPQDLDAMPTQGLGNSHSEFGRSPSSNIEHEHRRRFRRCTRFR
ncbi:hypothetical protein ABTM61_20435, partial [Acinetobacter baumannii]